MKQPRPRLAPLWAPAGWTAPDAYAVQAVARGEASPDQQKRAFDWIINRAAMTYEEAFWPDNARVTDYVLGRRSVGMQVVKLMKLTPDAITKGDKPNVG